MDEGLLYKALTVSVPSQGLTHLVLICLSGYLITHTHVCMQQIDSERDRKCILSMYTKPASSLRQNEKRM